MIKIKLNAMGEQATELEIIPGENLRDASVRALTGIVKEDTKVSEHFVLLVNGHIITPELAEFTVLKPTDNVLIAPKIKGDDAGEIFKLVVVIVVAYYTGGLFSNALGSALFQAGATMAAGMLMNSLIPPPVPPGMGLDSGNGDLAGSQMYSISGQSNISRKHNTVPKVYGTHRIFPTVAAEPYVEIEADPVTGGIVQYFYGLYDFGLGPAQIDDLRIGDTPLSEFADVQTRLVDFNKPAISEGLWDDALHSSLAIYKGDVERETISVALNGNRVSGGPLENYELERNARPNTRNYKQEITVTLVNPSGLYAFNPGGARGWRTIDLDIMISKVGEENWFGYNDVDKVDSSRSIGGSDYYQPVGAELFPPGATVAEALDNGYVLTGSSVNWRNLDINGGTSTWDEFTHVGIPKGATTIILKYTGEDIINKYLLINGPRVGRIVSVIDHPDDPTYGVYTFDTPLAVSLNLFSYSTLFVSSSHSIYDTVPADVAVTGKVRHEALVFGRARISRSEQGQVYSTFTFVPKETGSYKIKVTRIHSFSDWTSTVQDNLTWGLITTRFDTDPIVTDKRHVFLELRIRATNQLNGNIANLSGICSSVLDVYDGSVWSKEVTNNPAWIFCDLLTGEINKRALAKTRLDMDSILEWAEFCEAIPDAPPSQTFALPRFGCNFILDFSPTLQTAINMVMSAGQASLNIVDGKYGALVDKLRTVPVQIFTPRNSKSFSSQKNYTLQPNALKVSYIDPAANWEVREVLVYDSGYDVDTAETFEDIESFACTNPEQAWRLGRYMLAQNRLRQETISIEVDFENLVVTRGDYVQVTQDVMRVGGSPARVKSIVGNRIVIDDAIETISASYGFVFRSSAGVVYTNTLSIVSSDTFDLDGGDLPDVDDLIIIGVVGNIVLDCIVKAIMPGDDLSATLILVEKADAIYDAESTDALPDYSPQISPTSNGDFYAPEEVSDLIIVDSYYECIGGGPALGYYVDLDWGVPTNAAYEVFEIWVDSGKGYNAVDRTRESFYTYTAKRENLGNEHKFKIIGVSAAGKKLHLAEVGEVTTTIEAKSTPPSNVEVFNVDITGEVLQLFWTPITDCSCSEYIIRYSPAVDGTATWERSTILLRTSRDTSLAATQGRTGTYFIKAIDYEGNESATETSIVTTIPQLFNLNVIAETTDFPTLLGNKDRTVTETGALTLDNTVVGGVETSEYYSDGYYYYETILDLGEIYTVRLQSLIQAEGFSLEDLMSNWDPLSDLLTMSHAGNADWDVETHYRTTDAYNVMSEWVSLDLIDPISEGNQDNWTAWKKFTIGDATGRIYQFRLRLISNKVSVTPRVFDGTIKADMPDRIESLNDETCPVGGFEVVYTPAFKGPGTSPSVNISMQSAESGDYWAFTSRTLEGFEIKFYNKLDVEVERIFDAQIKGYGRKATAII